MRQIRFSSIYLILVLELIHSSRSHDDCNHDKVLNQFYRMCTTYHPPLNSLKRETNKGGGELGNGPVHWPISQVNPASEYEPSPYPQQRSLGPNYFYYPWQLNPVNPRRNHLQPAAFPNEPEDFASFNNWYLNPLYADAEGQSPIERWRRKIGHDIREIIWTFVREKCCRGGCEYPKAYWELDKHVNICGMR